MAYLPREERRAAIIEATVRVMLADGLEGVSARSVATAVEGSPGLIHQHFASVPELIASAWQKFVADSLVEYDQAVVADGEDPIREFFGNHVDPERAAEVGLWVSAWAYALRSPEFGPVYAETLGQLTAALRRAAPAVSELAAERTVLLGVALAGMQRIAPEQYGAAHLEDLIAG
ncbi:TetR/AcrR family transcriptional regulator [Leucobacter aridicollis]|uniref:TetR/AcrR family transcriptional repressor of bet genes n=1 Tax=Leucobacter aridicollis TaxID=283878 RepID=A0A852R8J1_9MICO|nr:TetR family transcriptional regulator [Leucobacter aridicollis]MBL3683377.1 TetR/AcrR family transcriptional regulator [Leucobacter aridicollis]NYD25616.1 TetR/AcrR family transcriptional repressor of bet genes [Leucobacter aridicollis]